MYKQFHDRAEAGQRLAAQLTRYANRPDVLVLALPRGGVPVAFEVAQLLNAPLDIFLVRKLGVPGCEELAFGAIASGGARVLNQDIVQEIEIGNSEIEWVTAKARRELERREHSLRGDRPPYQVQGCTVILVDDGVATGATMRAVIRALWQESPARLVVAVPVAPAETLRALAREVDEVVCLETPRDFCAISLWYKEFPQLADKEVRELLARADHERTGPVGVRTGDAVILGVGQPRPGG